MKLQRIRNVRGKVRVIMPPRIKMKLMRDVPRTKNFVERRRPSLETIIVLIPAIKIDLQSREIRGARNGDRAVLFPERRIRWTPKRPTKHTRTRRPLHAAKKIRELIDQRRAMRTDGGKKLRMAERQMQRTVSTHRNAGNRTIRAPRRDAVA